MSLEVWIVFALLLASVPLFASKRVGFDLVALGILATLLLSGILEPAQAFSGFSGSATVTIAAMFVLSEGLRVTGALERASALLRVLGRRSPWHAVARIQPPAPHGSNSRLGLEPRPLLIAVTLAASLSFITPVGYQTNTLVYGPGQYRFRDFVHIGTPLSLLVWALITLLLPLFWPLTSVPSP